jgi:hypothetical protein
MNTEKLDELRTLLGRYNEVVIEKLEPLIKPGDASHLTKIRVHMSRLIDSKTYSITNVMETIRMINELIGYVNTAQTDIAEIRAFLERLIRVITALKIKTHAV